MTAVARLGRLWRRVRLRDLVLLTLPLVALVGYLYLTSIGRQYRSLQWTDWWTHGNRVYDHLSIQVRTGFKNAVPAIALERKLDPEAPDGGVVRIDIRRADWDAIGQDPQQVFGHPFRAAIQRDNTFQPVSLRVRGDTSAHWTTEKASFTLQTKRNQLYRGFRRLGFTGKYVFTQLVTCRLAQEFGLLAPDTSLATVFLNDRFYGMYRVEELPNEEFLRRHGRMPGNMYRGDTAERGDVFHGVDRALFRNPYIWDRSAKAHDTPLDAMARLQSMLADLADPTEAAGRRNRRRYDMDEIGRLLALMLQTGDLYHISDIHNQFWYDDPSDGTLHPVPWDVYLHPIENVDTAKTVGGARMNLLISSLIRDPAVMEGALRYLAAQRAGGLLDRIAALARSAETERRAGLEYDRLREGAVVEVGSPAEAMAIFRTNDKVIRGWTDDSRIAFCDGAPDGPRRALDFQTRGMVGVDLKALTLEGPAPFAGPVRLFLDSDRNGRLDDDDAEVPCELKPGPSGGQVTPAVPVAMPAGISADAATPVPDPLHYRLFLKSDAGALDGYSVKPDLVNRVTGRPADASPWTRGSPISPGEARHPWDLRETPGAVVRLSGDVRLDHDLVIEAGGKLIVAPGTTVRMGPGVSIFTRGRVDAVGTEEDPISFVPSDAAAPWGVFAMVGHGVDGSVLQHCTFQTGSGASRDGMSFSGMVSLRRGSGVKLLDCEFRGNRFFDDTFHAVHSDPDIERCRFIDANSDAIDFDECPGGVIRECRFERSGNDAIDLMTSSPLIEGNVMIGSLDKGVSVGEGSDPLIVNNSITACTIGVEAKDGSAPFLVHNHIAGNRTGLRQRTKNWRYGQGGFACLVHTVVTGNKTDLASDASSGLMILDSVIGGNAIARDGHDGGAAEEACECLLARAGLKAPAGHGAAGLLAARIPIAALAVPLAPISFREDFAADLRDGWNSTGEILRLGKHDQDLRADFAGVGSIERPLEWNLAGPARRYLAVVQAASQDTGPVRVVVRHEGGEAVATGGGPAGLDRFEWIAVELPAGRCSSIRIETAATARRGHLRLRRVYVFERPGRSD